MKKMDVVAFESYQIDKTHQHIPIHLLERLYVFLAKTYHISALEEFLHLIIHPKKTGELIVLYGLKDDIAGFCRTMTQELLVGTKKVLSYTALVYLNSDYNPYPTTASLGLSQGIRYKLEHPEKEVVYVALANNPYAYNFFYQFVESFYPKPSQQVPEQILEVVEVLKAQNDWISTGGHPMIVNTPLVPTRSTLQDHATEESELEEYYLSMNSDYMQGNALLLYIPLHLANINYGLNPPNARVYFENPPHHLHFGQEPGASLKV